MTICIVVNAQCRTRPSCFQVLQHVQVSSGLNHYFLSYRVHRHTHTHAHTHTHTQMERHADVHEYSIVAVDITIHFTSKSQTIDKCTSIPCAPLPMRFLILNTIEAASTIKINILQRLA